MTTPNLQTIELLPLLGALLFAPGCGPDRTLDLSPDFGRATNVGVAQLQNKSSEAAIKAFNEALRLAPQSALAQRNLARAHLLANEAARALEVLERARALEPESATSHYLSGIANSRESKFEEAVEHFQAALRLGPQLAPVHFQLASAYQALERHPEAIEEFREAARIDPRHTAAHFRLAGYARRAGDRKEFEERQRELVRLRRLLGDADRSPEALEVCIHTLGEPPPMRPPAESAQSLEVRFVDATPDLAGLEDAIAATVLEADRQGRYTLVLINREGGLAQLQSPVGPNAVGSVVDLVVPPEILGSGPLTLRVGNFHDRVPEGVRYDPALHAHNDLLILAPGGAMLLQQEPAGSFLDVTAHAGLSELAGNAARWLDYDHDGDIDLAVATEHSLQLWQNGGDGRFENVTEAVGIAVEGAVTDIAAVDLDSNVAVDLILARPHSSTLVFKNQRTGSFAPQRQPPGPWPAARHLRVEDIDADGRPDAVLVAENEVILHWGSGGPPEHLEFDDLSPNAVVLIDYDNDGRLDLFIAGARRDGLGGGARLWRNAGARRWIESDAIAAVRNAGLPVVNDALAADLDADGDSDLLLAGDSGLLLLRNEGGHAAGQQKLRLEGTKSNPMAIGVRVELRGHDYRVARFVQTPVVEIGLAGHDVLDTVQTVWANGVVDNAIQVNVSKEPLSLVEKNVAAGSCPYLYAWDGEGFRFVTDVLGNSPVGLSLRRGVPLPADSDEFVWLGSSDRLIDRNGFYVVELTEELREVLFLDQAHLVAVDHAPGVEVHATDRLRPPPFPASELWALAAPRTPLRATGDDGIDRTDAVRAIDGVFAPPGALRPPPLRGQTQELVLTLDFGELTTLRHPVLALTGWLQYGDASTNIAMSQNRSLSVVPTTLEAENAQGAWLPVDVVVGMPAGKTKTIIIDLAGKLATETKRLRLRTTFELRWDRIALFERLPDSELLVRKITPATANLRHRGYSEIQSRSEGHPTTPDYNTLLPSPPWLTTPEGWATRFGDVMELIRARDGKLALMVGGDALELRFSANLPQPQLGSVRDFFFYSIGWDKDADHNVIAGDQIGPLPFSVAEDDSWRSDYNTRWVPGNDP